MSSRVFRGLRLHGAPIIDLRHSSIHNCLMEFLLQHRLMTTSKRVQDRSKKKRVHALEIATEKWKITSKVLFLMEILKQEREQIIPIRSLDQYRRQINLPKPHKLSDFIRKSPKLFEMYKDHKGVLWVGMTKEAEDLVREEESITEDYSEKAAEHVSRFLMMSIDKRLALDKIAHFRRDFGLPFDFRKDWVHRYRQHFRVVKNEDDVECPGLKAGSQEFDKRAVAVMHELLNFTIEKRLVTDHLTHFRRELVMPQKLMRLLLKHFGIFYVSERGKRFSVFLTEAYEGSELIEKCQLVNWKEKVQSLIGYRGRKKKIETFDDFPEEVDEDLFQSDPEEDSVRVELGEEQIMGRLADSSLMDDSEMEIGEISSAYKDLET
ncbi:unnamed protein product [Thlaspi arvense]|uniref:PORR domain-containing protein n=1 Tax=Thlaspi arvense TaxID=13288 RepID=A0AAU9S0W5_THLAR|nr:unnamed protein product [Thlaspi arvense]